MGKSTTDYANNIANTLKNVAKDNAIRNGIHDEGFNVQITKEDIKKGTDRSRIKEPVITSIVNNLNSAGFEATTDHGSINVFVPPVLGQKENFSLDEITAREKIIDEINTREAYKLNND